MTLRAIIADTGPLYAAVDTDDQYHRKSQQELAKINRENLSIIISYPIYLETHKLILQSLGIGTALKFSQEIKQKANLINPLPVDYEAATLLSYRFPDQKITLFDAVTAVLANQMKLSVWTYDYHFDVMQAQVWR